MERSVVHSNEAPEAIGPYSQAVKTQSFIFVSGQLPINPDTGELETTDIKVAARQSLKNVAAILMAGGSSLDNIVKTTLYITDMANFPLINEAYREFFKQDPPARACVEVSKLPKGADIEIEAIAIAE